jgi:hypothetical protein
LSYQKLADNASVMTGRHKGVYAYVKEKQPTVYLSGCVLHLIHISAKKTADALPSIDLNKKQSSTNPHHIIILLSMFFTILTLLLTFFFLSTFYYFYSPFFFQILV